MTAKARAEFAGDPAGHVEIDVDDLRHYHREYSPLMLANDRDAASAVQTDASAWGDALRRRAIKEQRNLIIDGTLKDPSKALTMASDSSSTVGNQNLL